MTAIRGRAAAHHCPARPVQRQDWRHQVVHPDLRCASAPDDFAIEVIGCTAENADRPVGQWQDIRIDDRSVRFLPVLATPDVHRRSRVPVSLQFTLAAMIRREAHRFTGRVLQFHHPGPPVAFLGVDAPKILTVHLNVADIAGALGESRWRRLPGALHRLEDLTLPRMDRIFLVNRAGIDFYRGRHPRIAERLAFLPTSVDQQHFRPLDETERQRVRRALLSDLGVNPDAVGQIVLFVGRLEAQRTRSCSSRPWRRRPAPTIRCGSSWLARAACATRQRGEPRSSGSADAFTGSAFGDVTRCQGS